MMATRRSLQFDTLDMVLPEIRALVQGHSAVGNWTLAQTCKHLADSFLGSMTGFDLRRHRIKRLLIGGILLRSTLKRGMPTGYTVDPSLTPIGGLDCSATIKALTATVAQYAEFKDNLQPHPLFGAMPRETWDRVHCVHCAHHLSFLIPNAHAVRIE